MQRKSQEIIIREIPYSPKSGKISYDRPHKREQHELDFVEILARFGSDIILIKPSITRGINTPDCEWRGKMWEIKSIMSMKTDNLTGLLKVAFKQSGNVILDLSKSKTSINDMITEVVKYFNNPKNKHGIMNHEIMVVDKQKYCIINKKMLKSK